MQNFLQTSRVLVFACAAALAFVPACGGGGGGGNSGGAAGGTENPFASTDLAGDWTGHLRPVESENLPWSNGEQRILSRNFYVRADANGSFTFCETGAETKFDGGQFETTLSHGEIDRKGRFTVMFRTREPILTELAMVCQMNAAKNLIQGDYELRVNTKNTPPNTVEAVDAGTFTLTLSSGPGHFDTSMFEGSWEGANYTYAPRYANVDMVVDALGSIIGGGVFDEQGSIAEFSTGTPNQGIFAQFDDPAIGRIGERQLRLKNGNDVTLLYGLMDETGTYLTGPVRDADGDVTFARLVKN